MVISVIPSPRHVPLAKPVDARALGFLWARVGLPRDVAIDWAGELDHSTALRVIAAYDEETFDIMDAAQAL